MPSDDAYCACPAVAFRSYPLISFVSSPVSARFLSFTVITSGRLCNSMLSRGCMTPTAWQIAESSDRAIFSAVAFGLLRFSQAQRTRLNSRRRQLFEKFE